MRHVQVIVPVCNAEHRIPFLIDHYAWLGLDPLFIVDERSRDRSLSILRSFEARVLVARSEYARVESLLFSALPAVHAEWILRFDDDEAPSGPLVHWIDRHLAGVTEPAVGFSRRWVRFDTAGRLQGSSCVHMHGRTQPDWQFRLFRPAAVRLIQDIHTPGFAVERYALAPEEACVHHFSWIVRSRDERRARIEDYERQSPGAGANFTEFYLPEERDPSFYNFTPVSDFRVEALARLLARTPLKEGAPGPPRACFALFSRLWPERVAP
jgi:hypothetical protein